jgi:hypothetical protein
MREEIRPCAPLHHLADSIKHIRTLAAELDLQKEGAAADTVIQCAGVHRQTEMHCEEGRRGGGRASRGGGGRSSVWCIVYSV